MKVIKSNMIKFAEKDYYVQMIVEAVNIGNYDGYDFNPAVVLCPEYAGRLKAVIYSILKSENHHSAKEGINRIASIFGTCPQYAERMIRGIENIQIQNQFGLDNLIIK